MEVIAFIVSLLFYIWFGNTMNSMNKHLGEIAESQRSHTRLLASIANDVAKRIPGQPQ